MTVIEYSKWVEENVSSYFTFIYLLFICIPSVIHLYLKRYNCLIVNVKYCSLGVVIFIITRAY